MAEPTTMATTRLSSTVNLCSQVPSRTFTPNKSRLELTEARPNRRLRMTAPSPPGPRRARDLSCIHAARPRLRSAQYPGNMYFALRSHSPVDASVSRPPLKSNDELSDLLTDARAKPSPHP